MAKKNRSEFVNRKHVARAQREAAERRKILMVMGGLAAVVLIILAWGYVQTYVFAPKKPVAVVNGSDIPRDLYQKRVKYKRFILDDQISLIQQQYQQFADTFKDSPDFLASFKQQTDQQLNQLYSQRFGSDRAVVDDMIEELLVAQEAATRGITVAEDEVTAAIDRIAAARQGGTTEASAQETVTARNNATATAAMFTPTPTLSTTTNITPTAVRPTPTINVISGDAMVQARATWEKTITDNTGLTADEYRTLMKNELLRQKVRDAIGAEAPSTALQAHARHIMVATEEEAQQVKARLDAGEDFAAVAQEVSTDTGSAADGGDLGWLPEGVRVAAFNDAAFSLDVGVISDPIQSSFGWHVIQVLAREDHELDPQFLTNEQSKAYNNWLKDVHTTADIQDLWTTDDAPPDPLAQQQQQTLPTTLPTPHSTMPAQ